jgi:integrase
MHSVQQSSADLAHFRRTRSSNRCSGNFDQKTVSVRRALIARKGGGYYFEEPKTKKSRRSIPLSESLINELRRHRRDQLELRMKLGADYPNTDLVFTTRIGTRVDHKNLAEKRIKGIRDKAEVSKIRLYDLRHTTATLLLSAGLNPKVVTERLGHASIVLTLDTYSHVLPTMQKDATDQIEKLMFGA